MLHAKVTNVQIGHLTIEVDKDKSLHDLLFCEVNTIRMTEGTGISAYSHILGADIILASDVNGAAVVFEGNNDSIPLVKKLEQHHKKCVPFVAVVNFLEFLLGEGYPFITQEQSEATDEILNISPQGLTDLTILGASFKIAFAQKRLLDAFGISQDKTTSSNDPLLQDKEIKQKQPCQRVYAIGNENAGIVKIGISANPKSRLKGIQTGCPYPLQLLAMSHPKQNAQHIETKLHFELAKYRKTGEWFDIEVLRYIDWERL